MFGQLSVLSNFLVNYVNMRDVLKRKMLKNVNILSHCNQFIKNVHRVFNWRT